MKIFFFDIDGTLIDCNKGLINPSDKTLYAFNELKKEYMTIIASGRCLDMIPSKIRDLNPSGYLLNNGSYCLINNEIVFSKTISEKYINDSLLFAKNHNSVFYLKAENKVFCSNLNHPLHLKAINDYADETTYYDYANRTNEKGNMISIFFNNKENNDLYFNLFKDYLDIRKQDDDSTYVDCNDYGVNKGTGVSSILDILNIKKEDAYAFGDSYNDLEMMENVLNSVAMGNAVKEVKKRCRYVTKSVMDDGIYEFLIKEKLIKPIN